MKNGDRALYQLSMSYPALHCLAEQIYQYADQYNENELHGIGFMLDCMADNFKRTLDIREVDNAT